MKKGIIMEVEQENAIVLTPDGAFRSIPLSKHQEWGVGDEVELPHIEPYSPKPKRAFVSPKMALVASLMVGLIFYLAYLPFSQDQTVVAYVNMDINPSVEMGVNQSLEVVDLNGVNQDGQHLIESMNEWSFQPLDQVAVQLIFNARDQGQLVDQEDILVSTSFIDHEHGSLDYEMVGVTLEEVEVRVNQFDTLRADAEGSNGDDYDAEQVITIHQMETEWEVYHRAKEKGVSTGKYFIYLQAVDQGLDITLDDVTRRTITDLSHSLEDVHSIFSTPETER